MRTIESDMRDWLLECFSEEYDQEQINELTYDQLVKSINRYYDGGMRAFRACSGWLMVEV